MSGQPKAQVVCRPIEDADADAVVDCLTRNFPERARAYWRGAWRALARREIGPGLPRYGQLLEVEGAVVGVLLQIVSRREDGGLRCNLSSWCVDPAFRAYAYLLQARAIRDRAWTYVNVTPAAHTVAFLEGTGFRRFAAGRLLFAPWLSRPRAGARVVAFSESAAEAALLSESQRRLLADHAALGCEALIGIEGAKATPLVFQRRRLAGGLIPVLHLIHGGDMRDLAAFAWPLGRHFARRGLFLCLVDAEGPAAGLVGRFFRRPVPHYFKGEPAPAPADLAYTEFVLFGR